MTLVFMEFWQHQCCGRPFAVEDTVTWPVVPVEGEGLSRMLGDVGRRIDLAVERHSDEAQHVTGTVRAIHSVFYELEWLEQHPDGSHGRAAQGSGVLRPVQESSRSEHGDELEWSGYLIELDRVSAGTALP